MSSFPPFDQSDRQKPERAQLLDTLHTLATLVSEGAPYEWTSKSVLGQDRAVGRGVWRFEIEVPVAPYFKRHTELKEHRDELRRRRA